MADLPAITGTQKRGFTLERGAVDVKARTVTLSFSSEEPVLRWFGMEILDHSQGAVDLKRLNNRAALLLNHDPDKQIGVVESAVIAGRKGRAVVRFGTSTLASEVFEDVKSGIRSNVSVGYEVGKMEKSTPIDGQEAFKVTRWCPLELSIVSIPADASVGVGRSYPHMETTVAPPAPTPEQERIEAITTIARHANLEDLGREAVLRKWTVDEFRDKALAARRNSKPLAEIDQYGDIGLDQRDIQSYSILEGLRMLVDKGRVEGKLADVTRASEKKYGRNVNGLGFIIPNDVVTARRDLTAGGFTAGGALVDTDLRVGSLIDKFRNEALVMSLGATSVSGLVGNVAFPTITGDSTASWYAENGDISESNITTGQLAMTPKRLGAYVDISRKLINQTGGDAENIVRKNIAEVMAIAIDLAAINGSGAAAQPLGILNTSGRSTDVTFGAAPTWAKVLSFRTNLATSNVRSARLAWLTTPAVEAKWKQVVKFTSTASPLWTDENTVNGFPAVATNQVPSDKVIFGDFSQLWVGNWANGLTVTIDPFTKATTGLIRVIVEQYADVALAQPTAFCVSTDSGAQ